MKLLRRIFLVLMLLFSINASSQILFTTEDEFVFDQSGWENFGQKSGDITTLNMFNENFNDYEINTYVPLESGILVLGTCSILYFINKRRKE